MYYSDSVGVCSVILCDTANQQFQMKRSNKEDVYSLTIFLYLHIALLVRITGGETGLVPSPISTLNFTCPSSFLTIPGTTVMPLLAEQFLAKGHDNSLCM